MNNYFIMYVTIHEYEYLLQPGKQQRGYCPLRGLTELVPFPNLDAWF